MTESHPSVDQALLTRLVGRLAPYIQNGRLRHSRLQRVIRSAVPDESTHRDLEATVISALKSANIAVDWDAPPLPATDSENDSSGQATRGGAHAHRDAPGGREDDPADRLAAEERVDVDHATAAAEARRFLQRSMTLRRPDRVLLTAHQEVGLALLMRSDGTHLSEDLPDDYRSQQANDSEGARAFDALILHNTRLAWSIAQRYVGQAEWLELEDVASYGYLGLIRAVQKYDGSKGFKFSTYATWWIRQSITRAIYDHGRLIRIPVHMGEKMSQTRAAYTRLQARDQKPTLSRLAAETGFDEKEIVRHLELMQGIHSLDAVIGEEGTTFKDFLISRTVDDDGIGGLDLAILRNEIDKSLAQLTEREAGVIRLRFGFVDDEARTLEEIGRHYGVTRERIRQIEHKALEKLKHSSRSARLRPWAARTAYENSSSKPKTE